MTSFGIMLASDQINCNGVSKGRSPFELDPIRILGQFFVALGFLKFKKHVQKSRIITAQLVWIQSAKHTVVSHNMAELAVSDVVRYVII